MLLSEVFLFGEDFRTGLFLYVVGRFLCDKASLPLPKDIHESSDNQNAGNDLVRQLKKTSVIPSDKLSYLVILKLIRYF